MRLFTAVLFEEEKKDILYHSVERLRKSARGAFTARENLHLTVNFIGETDRLKEIRPAMQNAVQQAGAAEFELSIGGTGKFTRREGDIWWLGVDREETLWRLQGEMAKELKTAGFPGIDDREYRPHLTLGRRVVTDRGFSQKEFEAQIAPVQVRVTKISLMKSEQPQGKLTYTEIYSVNFNNSK
jgi:2'-5' RNA ligase